MGQWKKTKRKSKKNLKTNENGNTTLQDLWDAAKVVVRGKFTMIQAYLNKQEKFQINNLALPKGTRKRRTNKCKISRRKKIIKIRDKTNKKETKNQWKDQWNEELVLWKDKQNW